MKTIIHILKDEGGSTAIEYALLASLISVAAIASMTALGAQLTTTFTKIQTSLAR